MKKKIKAILFIFSVSLMGVKSSSVPTNRKVSIDKIKNEVINHEYNLNKKKLIKSVNKYIKSVAPNSKLSAEVVINKCLKYNIDLSFVLAQGKIESHFGTKGLAKKTNSVWNVGAFDGVSYSKISIRNKYQTPNNSAEPYLKLLKNNYLVNKTTDDLLNNFVNKKNVRYATNLNYEKELKMTYEKIVTKTDIDELYQIIKK